MDAKTFEQLLFQYTGEIKTLVNGLQDDILSRAKEKMLLECSEKLLLNNVAATADSEDFPAANFDKFTVFICGSGGATFDIESYSPTGKWVILDSTAYTSDGVVVISGVHLKLRVRATSYSSGTWSVGILAKRT